MPTSTRRRFLQSAASVALASSLPRPRAAEAAELGPPVRQPQAGDAVLVLAGDLFLTTPLAAAAEPAATGLVDLCRSADAVLANLENGLSTVGKPELGGFRHGPALRGDPRLVSELTALNVRAVSLANNHTGNYGREALLQTCDALNRAGIAHAGAGSDVDAAFAPAFVPVRGRTIALCSVYSYYSNFQADDLAGRATAGIAGCRAYDVLIELPGGFDTSRQDEPPYRVELQPAGRHRVIAPLTEDVDRMTAAITAARRRADVVIVSAHLHWGRHLRHDVPAQKQAFARAAIDAGADLFVGHGPHVLRGVEVYKGRAIAHSLGNFVLQPSKDAAAGHASRLSSSRESVVLRVTLTAAGRTELEVVPIVIPLDGRPRLAASADADRITRKILALSAAMGTEWIEEGGRARLSLQVA